ncbi:ATPase family associated with various cellular activities (AAA) [Prosthecobacter debontii]|uniref:ATPase family associated with various cellular activities (AAA) n=1 Tax=Prosthecobacter debontii TaxID=48467 RepID=A0A1T4XA94_9BACT|nr:DNA repair ATPase [Prosthecobacter debontii]SKA86357.1 ATPase family associated with various cellular activities (AAA) [Prosthecobacter debontii]
MAETPSSSAPPQLEAGAYEVIRQRLDKHGAELQRRLESLNEDRKKEFGGIDTALLATTRLTTDNNCVPRDMVAVGAKRFLFGYNVHLGLRAQMHIEDVFSVYDYQTDDHSFHPNKDSLLSDKAFAEDFDYLYRYYKNASFLKFHRVGPHLYMGMQVGRGATEIKAFKWLVNDEAGTLQYLGNRFDHEFVFPTHQEFEWKRARREMYRHGLHPHISIEDRVFVETIGGDLTVKVENNTETGRGIYSEPVDNADQTLDDAEVHYAILGNLVLMKVLPYQEKTWRYLVFNERTREAHRVDSIAESCVLLPDDHGLIFPHGYVLQTGELKRFDTGLPPMRFERRVTAANGEDTLFVFGHVESGSYLLLSYNLITQSVATPIICQGYSLFPSGELILFQGDEEPRKHHVVQAWRTPFVTADLDGHAQSQSFLGKIGNAEIVRCMAECRGILTLLAKDDSFSGLYVELARASGDIADSYFWIDREESHKLKETLIEVKGAAEAALGEFEKVRRMRKAAQEQTEALRDKTQKLLSAANGTEPSDILGYVNLLASLRESRGQIIALRDVRYVDLDELTKLESGVAESSDKLSEKCVAFLLKPEALDPYRQQITEQQARVPSLSKVTEAAEVEEALVKSSGELEMLTGIVSGLKIKDATETTRIIEAISTLFAQLNQVRSVLRNRRNDLAKSEGAAQFQAQLSLLNQSVLNYLEVATTPEKCDESLTRVMVQIEELESRFSEFDDYAVELTSKREEIHAAFEGRRQSLVDARNRRCQSLGQSAERILTSVRNRLAAFAKPEEVHSWLAGDAMVGKLRDLIEELRKLGDSVRADELQTKLKTLQQDSLKQIRDKAELFVEGGDLIQLGKHKFSVNRQPLELTILPRDEGLAFHLTGTRYFERLDHPELMPLKPIWEQAVVSENDQVYRAEFLAWKFMQSELEFSPQAVSDFMAQRYHEGYTKGVHDHDAALILQPLLEMKKALGLLRHSALVRGLAVMVWHAWEDSAEKQALRVRMMAKGRMRDLLGHSEVEVDSSLLEHVSRECRRAPAWLGAESTAIIRAVALCLVDELQHLSVKHPALPVTRSGEAVEMLKGFRKELTVRRGIKDLEESLEALSNQPWLAFEIAVDWFRALNPSANVGILAEAAALLVLKDQPPATLPSAPASHITLTELTGSHARIQEGGRLSLDFHEFVARLQAYESKVVPDYERFQTLKHELTTQRRDQLRLDQFKAGVLSSFVRNRLIDQVYLPIIGANLAKQIGAVGNDTRTDRMGLLLLISPPGYGKTTLMEYVASRLGITLVKINGPAIGHQVTSLDPAEAPNASARDEVEKLNLALEMGDNVMIYLDDIQHTNPEFLQKFISLCDGTRKIEGVFRGQAKTYDLRGRKVAVVMAGNPYTEVGGKFQVPDMLANRADTYNLGDILGGHEAAFKDSYIENCLTSNASLARVAARSHRDALATLKIAMTGSREGIEFEGNQSVEDINDCVTVMEKLLRVREVILRVNQEYIRSAAMEDAYRTEPPFKLQGSYRNMNKIAEKIQPLMTDAEVQSIIEDHYRGESQTLSKAAEANLLKWREINGKASEADLIRWTEIKRTFGRNLLAGGAGENDPISRITGQMNAFTAGLEKIEQAVANPTLSEITVERLQKIIESLRAVPVQVEIKVQPVEKEAEDELPVAVKGQVTQKE